ncbi:hypothetical protein E2C01_049022 [Portunus trituberculatus]|uniref:Uncharacterized protein n=1 Tax=Portunus trituberculatus TaxID=210409 RepID=A0A5B7G4K1_PORTR|nr:hypothetical protein [Portunus trituberculatus]
MIVARPPPRGRAGRAAGGAAARWGVAAPAAVARQRRVTYTQVTQNMVGTSVRGAPCRGPEGRGAAGLERRPRPRLTPAGPSRCDIARVFRKGQDVAFSRGQAFTGNPSVVCGEPGRGYLLVPRPRSAKHFITVILQQSPLPGSRKRKVTRRGGVQCGSTREGPRPAAERRVSLNYTLNGLRLLRAGAEFTLRI